MAWLLQVGHQIIPEQRPKLVLGSYRRKLSSLAILTWALCTCRLEAQVDQEGIGKTDQMQVCHSGSLGAVLVLAQPQQLLTVFEELLHCPLDILAGSPICSRTARSR
jgi:hypothetical protein